MFGARAIAVAKRVVRSNARQRWQLPVSAVSDGAHSERPNQRSRRFYAGPATVDQAQPQIMKGHAKSQESEVSVRDMASILRAHLWPKDDPSVRARVSGALGLILGANLVNVAVPQLFKHAVDTLTALDAATVATGAAAAPTLALLGWGAARTLHAALNESRSALFASVTQRGVRELAKDVFNHILHLDMSWHLDRQTGALSRSIDRGMRGISYTLRSTLFMVVPTVFEIGLVCGILQHQCGAQYAGLTAGTIGAYIAWTLAITQKRIAIRKAMNQLDSQANAQAIDALMNYETVKFFNGEQRETKSYDEKLEKYQKAALETDTSLALLNFGQKAIFTAGSTAALYLAAQQCARGELSVGDVVMIQAFLAQLAFPLNFVGSVYRDVRQSLMDLQAMLSLLKAKPQITSPPNAPPLSLKGDSVGSVTFDNVTFSYNEERRILDGCSFSVPAGKSVAIVGPSGCGKSTILRLLYRFYDPSQGSIRVDGQEITQTQLVSLRDAIGVVPQDCVLFNDTIANNIAYGKELCTREEVITAAKRARIHESIMRMPQGYDTLVGERGLKLSGGEKQRVAIARMILKEPAIVVCDEATSALDTQTEAGILRELRELTRGKTSIVVAHRLSTVADADMTLVMREGRVVEQGTHRELLAKQDSLYREMWLAQAQAHHEHSTEETTVTIGPQ
ncbi:MAG: hypothetical protein MHM6MM_004191 [Cercozoa sp. M6MM]